MEKNQEKAFQADSNREITPIEPEKTRITKQHVIRWLIFLVFVIYVLITYFHASILTGLGRYLILEKPPEKSDLLVCLAGGNIERGLATADAYQDGLAPRIFIAREELPDGYELLRDRGVQYPESRDLFIRLLLDLGVPESAILTSDVRVNSTMAEARLVKEEAEEREIRSLILITSPIHTRRAWLTYRKVFEKTDVRIGIHPSEYSGFDPKDWWKKRRYVKQVIVEYQKLIFYALKYFI
jgi:uncharacterized SAM-binding protein YcdF (DUF218 family)